MLHRIATPLLISSVPSLASSSRNQSLRLISSSRLVNSSGKSEASPFDPGYTTTKETTHQAPPAKEIAPSTESDPFPLPFDPRLVEGLSLSSKHQLENLTKGTEEDFPLRVPGREPGQETREVKIARLRYQIRHRGILETDLLLSTFAKEHLETLSDEEADEFDVLLDEPDWDIYYWMTARKEVPERWKESFETENRLGWRLRKHTKNENKETRSMPAL